VRLVDGISFDVHANEVFGVVGESGSGKSITMLAIMGLLPAPHVRVAGGRILFRGRDLVGLTEQELRRVRGGRLGMIFQDPMTSLNPVLRVGRQIGEAIRIHNPQLSEPAIRTRVIELLDLVEVPNPERRYRQFPHEFSGGMRQRAMIAMALANEPALLIADEPTTALDVTIQAQIMALLASVRERTSASMILITHDLGLVAETADRIAVMYGGRILETSDVATLFETPKHPYTIGLLQSLPELHAANEALYSIPGQPPDPADRPAGCVFHPRCGLCQGRAVCGDAVPLLEVRDSPEHGVACHFADETRAWAAGAIQRTGMPAVDERA
jgi:peptide/nickel transport system ATP-binding protein